MHARAIATGFETAKALASANATVVIASYDASGSGEQAAANITAATGNSKVTVVPLDLSSFASVKACAADIKQSVTQIEVLVCDAGITSPPHGLSDMTEDGFERVIQTNFLGHVLLINELEDLIEASATRILHVSSDASFDACSWGDHPESCTAVQSVKTLARTPVPHENNSFSLPASNYGLSKYLQVFHAAGLAAKEHEVGPPAGYESGFEMLTLLCHHLLSLLYNSSSSSSSSLAHLGEQPHFIWATCAISMMRDVH